MAILDPNPPEFPAAWAVAYGEDRYGLWQAFQINGVRQVMRWIEPGQFLMGSPESEQGRDDDERQHQVTLTRGFWLADTTCTQALWQAVTRENPSHNEKSAEHPVESVSWNDCQSFIDECNQLLNEELVLRLPTEAEWEYACRGGTTTAYSWGDEFDDRYANNGDDTILVLNYRPNPNGLFQMHGNVDEWCADWFAGEYPDESLVDPKGPESGPNRVRRGGNWLSDGRNLRSAYRYCSVPDARYLITGLRLAGG